MKLKHITRLLPAIILAAAAQSCADEGPDLMCEFTAKITPISITSTKATFNFEAEMLANVSNYWIYASGEDDYRQGNYNEKTNILTFTNLHPGTEYKIVPCVIPESEGSSWGAMTVNLISDEWTFTTLSE